MQRDRLYLLDDEFPDEALPGRNFYCRDCITVAGLLAAFPVKAAGLEVIRVPFKRPRAEVIAVIGEDSQEAPVLVLADDAPDDLATGTHGGTRFVNQLRPLLHALHVRHGFPEQHP